MYTLLANGWGKICVNFAIAGNLGEDMDGNFENIRTRLKLYKSMSDDKIVKLQSNIVTNIITGIVRADTSNIINIIQCHLFTKLYQDVHDLKIDDFNNNKGIKSHINEFIYIELFSDIDPWDFPGSLHKLIFEMYDNFSIWDHLQLYMFRNPNNNKYITFDQGFGNITLNEYILSYDKWISQIIKYFDVVVSHCDLAQGIMFQQPVLPFIISSYILTGNKQINDKIDKIIQSALNKSEDGEIINESLSNKNTIQLLKYCMIHRSEFLQCFSDDQQEQIKQYNQFIHWIGDGVIAAIDKFRNILDTLLNVQSLNFGKNHKLKFQLYFATKGHILSIISNIFHFIDYNRSNNLKWKQNNDKKSKLVDQTFSKIILSSSSPKVKENVNYILQYIFTEKDGFFANIEELNRNKYFENNPLSIDNLSKIISFLSHHWKNYIYIHESIINKSFNYQLIFNCFHLLKYSKFGKIWINFLNEIIKTNKSIKDKLNKFIKEKQNDEWDKTLNNYMDSNIIKNHTKQCKNSSTCYQYHEKDRQQFINLFDNDLIIYPLFNEEKNSQDNDDNNNNNNKWTKPLKKKEKKGKKQKQFKITEWYSSQSSSACSTPGGPQSDDDDDVNMSEPSPPRSLLKEEAFKKEESNESIVVVLPFTVLDKQLYANTNKLMYFIDYTEASRHGPEWQYKNAIKEEFGAVGLEIIKEYDENNREKVIQSMWEVKEVINKRVIGGEIQYEILWDGADNETSWEKLENLTTCRESINDFELKLAAKKKKKSAARKRLRAIKEEKSLVKNYPFYSNFGITPVSAENVNHHQYMYLYMEM